MIKCFFWTYEFVLSTELAKLECDSTISKNKLICKLADFFRRVLPFAKLGAAWSIESRLCVAQLTGSAFCDDINSYDLNCRAHGYLSVDETMSEMASFTRFLISFKTDQSKHQWLEVKAKWNIRSINRGFLMGREIRHVVILHDGVYVAKSVIIRYDGTSLAQTSSIPSKIDPTRVDSFVYSDKDPQGWILADPVPWSHFEFCGLPPYDIGLLSGKTNIPIVIDDIFNVVVLKYGYVLSTCGTGCSCCYIYDNIIPCFQGMETVKDAFIHMSISYLDKYLFNYNRLHSKEHFHLVMLDLLK